MVLIKLFLFVGGITWAASVLKFFRKAADAREQAEKARAYAIPQRWADRYYPKEQRQVAALAVDVLTRGTGLSVHELTPATSFIEDLGMESGLERADFVLDIQAAFRFQIPEQETAGIATLDQWIQYLHKRVEGRKKLVVETDYNEGKLVVCA